MLSIELLAIRNAMAEPTLPLPIIDIIVTG
jgi:hypothetical protein